MARMRAFGSLLSLIALMVALPSVSHGQYTLVLQSGETYEIREASEFLVNGKDFGRIWPGGATVLVNPSNVGKLRQQKYSGTLSVRKSPQGVLMSRSDSGWQNWIPEGKSKEPETAASLWSHARIEYRKNRAEKTLTPISWETLYLLVPGPDAAESLARVLADPKQFEWAGNNAAHPNADRSPKDILSEQVNLRAALVNAYPKSAAATRIHEASLDSMRKYGKWEDGGLPVTDLEEGIEFGSAAVRVFPDDPELAALLNRLRARKQWIDREVAILSAMKAGEQCDGFLAKYSEFEQFDSSFGNLGDARRACYASSADAHLEAGRRLASKNDTGGALREFRIAKQRSPGNESVRYELENVRLAAARVASNDLRNHPQADTISTAQIELTRHLQLAERNVADGNQSQADDELGKALAIDPHAPQVQFTLARLAQAKGELSKAISYLESYESAGIPADQLSSAEQLRTSITYDLQKRVQALHERVSKAVEEHHFLNAMNASVEGLKLDADDVQFLYQAGANAAIMRKPAEAKRLLERYIKVSDSLAGDSNQRRVAMAVLKKIGLNSHPVEGSGSQGSAGVSKSWFSGSDIPSGIFYDPVSLAFQPKIGSIKASKKMTVVFRWNADRLTFVEQKYENSHAGANAFRAVLSGMAAYGGGPVTMTTQGTDRSVSNFSFKYYDDAPQVLQISGTQSETSGGYITSTVQAEHTSQTTSTATVTETDQQDPTESQDSSEGFLTLWNNPRVDPEMALLITGNRITTGFSGNAFFSPFVWDAIHIFDFVYDQQGRVTVALEHGDRGQVEFSWSGNRLTKIIKRSDRSSDASIVYTRTLNYSGDKLVSEVINYNGRTSKIVYKYDGQNKLIEADCEEDPSTDGRSRKAIFM